MSRFWCFVSYGKHPPLFLGMDYITYQQEKGEKTGRLHWQGFFSVSHPYSESMARETLSVRGLSYLKPARTLQGAIRYCQKHRSRNSSFVELGIRPHFR